MGISFGTNEKEMKKRGIRGENNAVSFEKISKSEEDEDDIGLLLRWKRSPTNQARTIK